MTQGAKKEHASGEGDEHRGGDDDGELPECVHLAEVQSDTRRKCCHSAAKNADAHLLESLLHFETSVILQISLVAACKVHNEVDGQSNYDYEADALSYAKLPAIGHYDGKNAEDYHGDAENCYERDVDVAGSEDQHDKAEDQSYANAANTRHN